MAINSKTMKFNPNQKLLFFILFVGLGLAALQVPLVHLAGSKAQFTLFDSFGPIAAGFIGTMPGMFAVFLMQFINFLIHGSQVVDIGTIIRFIPMLFATMYFGKRTKLNLIIPVLAIIAFNLNPIGRTVWFYSLFWLIPIVCYFWQEKFLLARALGATFTAHAVGGAIWIWSFHLQASIWVSLIPIVIVERLVFAMAMVGIYQAMKVMIQEMKQYAIHTN